MIQLKRAYEPPAADDGMRILVERLWPRGLRKDEAAIDMWLKEVAPSTELRQWFGHDQDKWKEFQKRYRQELQANAEKVQWLLETANKTPITLVYAARDEAHNSALVLKEFLEARLRRRTVKGAKKKTAGKKKKAGR